MAMPMCERHTHNLCPKGPSFSSSLLDAIYRSIDETRGANDHRRNNAAQVEEDIESLRRALMIEKWMENYATSGASRSTPRHFPSISASSTDSSVFSSSETDSSPKSSQKAVQTPKREGRFTKTKSRAQKIYGELKKVKEPISPGGKISNFLNSIFSPRNLKSSQGVVDHEWSSMRKSRSMKDTTTCSLAASRSCLSKNASSRGSKSKRSVRFCPVSVIVDEDCQPCGHKSIYNDELTVSPPEPSVGTQFIKKNIDSFRVFEGKNVRKYDCYNHHSEQDLDGVSCASSDLFELENIGRAEYEEELPVYETTSLHMNQSIAGGLVIM